MVHTDRPVFFCMLDGVCAREHGSLLRRYWLQWTVSLKTWCQGRLTSNVACWGFMTLGLLHTSSMEAFRPCSDCQPQIWYLSYPDWFYEAWTAKNTWNPIFANQIRTKCEFHGFISFRPPISDFNHHLCHSSCFFYTGNLRWVTWWTRHGWNQSHRVSNISRHTLKLTGCQDWHQRSPPVSAVRMAQYPQCTLKPAVTATRKMKMCTSLLRRLVSMLLRCRAMSL